MITSKVRALQYNSGETVLLPANPKRRGFILENASDTALYVLFNERAATQDYRTLSLPAQAQFTYLPMPEICYKGVITFKLDTATNGQLFITEFVEE